MPQTVPMTYCAKCVHFECDAGPGADPYRTSNKCAAPARDEAEWDRRRPKLQGYMPLSAAHDCDSFEAGTAQVAEVQTLPTSQEVADTLSRAYDAACDVLAMLDESRICPTPGSLEHIAFAALMERVVHPGRDFALCLSHYLQHLPEPTDARRHDVPGPPFYDDDIPF